MAETSPASSTNFLSLDSCLPNQVIIKNEVDAHDLAETNFRTSINTKSGSLINWIDFQRDKRLINVKGESVSFGVDKLSSENNGLFQDIKECTKHVCLPKSLLEDIRSNRAFSEKELMYNTSHVEMKEETQDTNVYKFYIHENANILKSLTLYPEGRFFKNIPQDRLIIRSAKGTVRGVKNRVREGIATFLHINAEKIYKEREIGKVVVYTTSIGVLRKTYQACMRVKQILRTLFVKFEERDVFMNSGYQIEIQERMGFSSTIVPQVFANGCYIGDAEKVEKLNETGELRRMLEPFKTVDHYSSCAVCGGYRLLPCQICKGSKKSKHRNHFTTEFVALKCVNCDDAGLVRCISCS